MSGQRQRSSALALGLVVVLVLTTACGPAGPSGVAATPTPTGNQEPGATASSSALRVATEPPELTAGGVLVLVGGQACHRSDGVVRLHLSVAGVYPPSCEGGVVIDGLDLNAVPDVEWYPPSEPQDAGEVTWAVVTLLGTWDGDRLQVEQVNPPRAPDLRQFGEHSWCAGGSCTPRDHGEPTTCPRAPAVPEDTTEMPAFDVRDAIEAYRQARPDIDAGSWIDRGRLWTAFTNDPSVHTGDLCAIDPTIAIVQLPHSLRTLQDLQAQMLGYADAGALTEAATPTGEMVPGLMGSGVDVENNQLDLTLQFADKTTVDTLLRRYGADRLAIHSWMIPVTMEPPQR